MAYEIESGVAMPGANGPDFGVKYPWDKMKPGDSIFVPETDLEESKRDAKLGLLRRRVYNAARAYGDPRGMKFNALYVEEKRLRPDGETTERGIRCWLVSVGEKTSGQTGQTGAEIVGGLEAQREAAEGAAPSE